MSGLLAIGFSAGGFQLASRIFEALPAHYPLAVAVVAHLPNTGDSALADMLGDIAHMPVIMARDKTQINAGQIYLAPPGYHLLVEDRSHFSLSVDAPVMSVRPSIDVLFESAAEAYEKDLIAVALSGANSDGARGMARVHELGGTTIVLNPLKAEYRTLCEAVVDSVDVDYISDIDDIIALLCAVEEKP